MLRNFIMMCHGLLKLQICELGPETAQQDADLIHKHLSV